MNGFQLKETEDMRAPLAFPLGRLEFARDFKEFRSRREGADTFVTAIPKSDKPPYSEVSFVVTGKAVIRRLIVTGQDRGVREFSPRGASANREKSKNLQTIGVPPHSGPGVPVIRTKIGADRAVCLHNLHMNWPLSTRRLAILLTLAGSTAFSQQRTPVQDDLLREYTVPMQRLLDLAKAIPADKYSWRPNPNARSISEVIVHVSINSYPLLEMIHRPFPAELYPGTLPESGPARQLAMFHHNLAHEKAITGKAAVIALAEKALAAAEVPLRDTPADRLNDETFFVERRSTVGGIHMRIMAHIHEHLGQLIAYARSVGVVPPWSQPKEQ